jgi:hypothetical protein
MKGHRAPTHPGGILNRLYLQPMNLSTVDLANALRVSRKTIDMKFGWATMPPSGDALRPPSCF